MIFVVTWDCERDFATRDDDLYNEDSVAIDCEQWAACMVGKTQLKVLQSRFGQGDAFTEGGIVEKQICIWFYIFVSSLDPKQ